jgi:hypothetical protein
MSNIILEEIVMEKELKEKLEAVVELVNNVMVNPDIDLEYCIPEVATTSEFIEQIDSLEHGAQ